MDRNYIKCLNRNTLIEYLLEENYIIEAQILQSRDIDGERFLNFTELDLVQWGLKANQKKLLLNCRNKLLASAILNSTIPKRPYLRLRNENLKPNKPVGATKQRKTTEKPRLLSIGSSSKQVSSVTSEPTPKIPERPKSFKRKIPQYVASRPSPTVPQETVKRKLSSSYTVVMQLVKKFTRKETKENLIGPAPKNVTTDYRKPKQTLKPQLLQIQSSTVASNLKYSDHSSKQVRQEVIRDPSSEFRENIPPLPARPFRIKPNNTSEETITRAEPVFKSKPFIDRSIQDASLSPIPNRASVCIANTLSILPPLSNKCETYKPTEKTSNFIAPHQYWKPKLLPKPDSRRKENWIETTRKCCGLNVRDLPPRPQPEFSDDPKFIATAQDRIWNVLDESQLPRPPLFNSFKNQYYITRLPNLLSDCTPPSDELVNPNNGIFYRNTDRKGARQLLGTVKDLKNDTFLLRPSGNKSFFFGLTIFHGGQYYNLGICRDINGKYFCQSSNESQSIKFNTPEAFINYYKNNALSVENEDGKVVDLYLKYSLPEHIFEIKKALGARPLFF